MAFLGGQYDSVLLPDWLWREFKHLAAHVASYEAVRCSWSCSSLKPWALVWLVVTDLIGLPECDGQKVHSITVPDLPPPFKHSLLVLYPIATWSNERKPSFWSARWLNMEHLSTEVRFIVWMEQEGVSLMALRHVCYYRQDVSSSWSLLTLLGRERASENSFECHQHRAERRL